MPVRHAAEYRDMNENELANELAKNHQELFNLRFQIATRKLKNHQRVRAVKREVARILTVARERELQALYDQAMALFNEAAGIEMPAAEEAAPAAEPVTTAPRRRGLFSRS